MQSADRYSRGDRLLHRLAFSMPDIWKSLSDLEDRLYSERYRNIPVTSPVFITSLPRAGTTLLLDILYDQGGFGTHTYRDMPFIMVPMFWDSISAPLRSNDTGEMERMHGDGMMVGYDSPEAFEEVLWRAFWPDQYLKDGIALWPPRTLPKFNEFFIRHIQKLVSLRGGRRYVSKNNANVSRIPHLLSIFPDAKVVVPFREPIAHATSLMTQHGRFKELHGGDEFARRYMEDIGHLDFGLNFRPIQFPGLQASLYSPDTLDFWLMYWCSAFQYLLSLPSDLLRFFDYDACCAMPTRGLQRLATIVDVPPGGLVKSAERFRAPTRYPDLTPDPELRAVADEVYRVLQRCQ